MAHEGFAGFLEAAKDGAAWAWEALYRDYYGPVMGYLASRGASDAEGLCGDVLLKVARGIHDFEGDESSFRSWLFVIAHRRLLDERRMLGRRPDFVALMENMAGGDVEREALDRLVTEELMEAFGSLTEGQRDVLSLRIIAGLTLRETADVLETSTGAVKVMQHRAISALRDKVERKDVTL